MEYRFLGRTGVKVSAFCLGDTMQLYYGAEGNTKAIIDKALDAGINFIETTDHTKASQETIGRYIKQSGTRDRIILAVRSGLEVAENPDPNNFGMSRRYIIKQCDEMLRRLQTDYIDLYYLLRLRSTTPIDEPLRALDDLIRAGKVRYVGTSSASAWELVESLWVAKELGLNRFVSETPPYNLLDRRIEREVVPMALTYGFAICPWAPLAAGILTGKYRRGEPMPTGTRLTKASGFRAAGPVPQQLRSVHRLLVASGIDPEKHPLGRASDHFYYDRLSDRTFDVVEQLEAMAREKECTPGQLALAWCRAQPGITSPLIGPRNVEQLDDYLATLNVTLTPEDMDRIDLISPPQDMITPYYLGDFGPHIHRW